MEAIADFVISEIYEYISIIREGNPNITLIIGDSCEEYHINCDTDIRKILVKAASSWQTISYVKFLDKYNNLKTISFTWKDYKLNIKLT